MVPADGGGGSEYILTAIVGQGAYPPEVRDPLIGSFIAAVEPFTKRETITYSRKPSPSHLHSHIISTNI